MSTLVKSDIQKRLDEKSYRKKLVITPIVDDSQIGNFSVDLRLSNQFIIFNVENFESFNPLDKDQKHHLYKIQDSIVVPFGQHIILHPGSLVLGATFEYIRMPENVEGQVEGRSSWARLGLVIATATSIDPGFCGSITLELSNLGKVPLVLVPGSRVCQLVLRETTGDVPYDSSRKYYHAVGPQFSRLYDDKEIPILQRIQKRMQNRMQNR